MSSQPALLALLLAPAIASPQTVQPGDYKAADLAVRARAVLAKHCSGCHGDKPARSTLRVLDHKAMTAPRGVDRPVAFITAAEPAASLALDLIKDGSMPPGAEPKVPAAEVKVLEDWIREAGAAAYPVLFDDAYAHRAILADVERLPQGGASAARYLSLHHVAATAPADLGTARAEFLTALPSVLNAGGPYPVDPAGTLFRIDLGKSGWGHAPFVEIVAKKDEKTNEEKDVEGGPVPYNLFDLAMLEYPHVVIPEASAAFDQLAKAFLLPSNQIRPAAFVRGDWFVNAVRASPLKNDLRFLMPGPVPPGISSPLEPKVGVRAAEAPDPRSVTLPALDAWHAADDPPDPKSVKNLVAETFDAKTGKPRRTFFPDDVFYFQIQAAEPAYVQYLYVELTGTVGDRSRVGPLRREGYSVSPNLPGVPGNLGFAEEYGDERLRAFAGPREFHPGELWRAKPFAAVRHRPALRNVAVVGGVWQAVSEAVQVQRFVHKFFPLRQTGGRVVVDLADARIARKTATIRIAENKK